jgi:altronate dehydratase small subunit
VRDIPRGEDILKYEEVIGRATHDIPKEARAYIHRIEGLRGPGDLKR